MIPIVVNLAILFLLKGQRQCFCYRTKEKFKLTQKAIDYAVNSVNTLAESVCDDIREYIRKKFEQQGHSVTVADVTSCCVYNDPFSNLKTEYLLPNSIEKTLDYL